jgi:hypothetical protein
VIIVVLAAHMYDSTLLLTGSSAIGVGDGVLADISTGAISKT